MPITKGQRNIKHYNYITPSRDKSILKFETKHKAKNVVRYDKIRKRIQKIDTKTEDLLDKRLSVVDSSSDIGNLSVK